MSPRFVLAVSLALALPTVAAPPSPRVLERYREMLAANPVEGTALDRLWSAYSETGQTGDLLAEYRARTTFADRLILGHLLHRAGRDDEAATAFKTAATLDAKSPLPLLALASLQASAEAAATYEKALTLLPPDDPRLPEILNQLGRAWLAAGDVEKAGAAWERTVTLNPANIDLRRRLAASYRENRLPERALPHLSYIATHAPVSERATAYQEISQLHQALRQPDEAIRALEQSIALTAPGSWLWTEGEGQLVRLHQRFGRTAQLEERWQKQAAASPRDLGAQLQLLELYRRLGDLEQQRALLERITALVPKNAAYRLQLARLLVELNRAPEAATLYDALLAEQPAQADLVFERALLDLQAGDPTRARTRIAALLARPGADEATRNRAADFYREHRLQAEAEQLLQADAARGSEENLLALAQFLFAQKREQEGEATLRRLVPAGASPVRRATALVRVAQLLKAQNLAPATTRTLREALPLSADDPKLQREIALQLSDAALTSGDFEAARRECLTAARASRTPAEEEEVDNHLFEVLRHLPETKSPPKNRRSLMPAPPMSDEENLAANPALAAMLKELTDIAEANPSEQAWMRVARWHALCHDAAAAQSALGRALAVNPQSLAAHEAAVKLNTNPVVTRWHLEALMRLDPAHAVSYRRRLAMVDLQAGQLVEAIRALGDLAREAPGNLDLLVDLAQAQQRAERWPDAIVTWEKLLAIAPAARRREAVAPLLRLYERRGQPQKVAALLLAQCEAQTELRTQLEAFKDLLSHCEKNNLLDWLQTKWEARRQGRLDDYAGEIAYAQLLQAKGDANGAFRALSDALYSAPNPADALPELVRHAEDLHRLGAAVDFQSRLVRLGAQQRPDELLKLADLQERNFDLEGAEQTWRLLAGRFPREVAVLESAAEFHRRIGDDTRAAEALRQVRALDPANQRALFTLAGLATREGRLAEAEACLEDLLKQPRDEEAEPAIRFPAPRAEDAARLQTAYLRGLRQRRAQPVAGTVRALRDFWSPTERLGGSDLRLLAVRDLASLMLAKEDPAALQAWIARWQAKAKREPSETLWALFYARAGAATLSHVESLLQREPENAQFQQGYLWMALQLREFPKLAEWLRDTRRTVAEREFFRVALAQHLQETPGFADPELVRTLRAKAGFSRRWELAQSLAGNACYTEAIELGREVLTEDKSNRVSHGWELAQWELALGQPEAARRHLAEAGVQPAESLDAMPLTALRSAYLLLPAGERPAFVAQVERGLSTAPTLSAALTRVLLHGLAGRDDRTEIRALLNLRALFPATYDELTDTPGARSFAGERSWEYIRALGLRLQSWGLCQTAQLWWDEALSDNALIRLQGEVAQAAADEVRYTALALQIARAEPDDVADLLVAQRSWLPRSSSRGGDLGEALEQLGAQPRAIEVMRRLWESDPNNGQILRSLLNACRAAGDQETAEAVLQTCVAQRLFSLNENVQRDLVYQLLDLLEKRGATSEARALLERQGATMDPRLLARGARLAEKADDLSAAEKQWRRLLANDPTDAPSRLALAALLARTGHPEDAIPLLKRGGAPGAETKLAELLYAQGKVDEALTVIDRVGGTDRLSAPLALGRAMLAKQDTANLRPMLRTSVARTLDPAGAMELQALLLESFQPGEKRLLECELRKLRQLVGEDAGRLAVWFDFLHTHRQTLGLAERATHEMNDAWMDGAGLLAAGQALVRATLEDEPARAPTVLEQILARRDVSTRTLQSVLALLAGAGQPALAARVEERLLRLDPTDPQRLASCVKQLVVAGQPDRAIACLQAFGARAQVDEPYVQPTAQAWMTLGQPAAARLLLDTIAPPRHGILRGAVPYIENARARLALGDLSPAKALLRQAYLHPGYRDFAPLIEWLSAAGKLQGWQEAVTEFRFSPARLEALSQLLRR